MTKPDAWTRTLQRARFSRETSGGGLTLDSLISPLGEAIPGSIAWVAGRNGGQLRWKYEGPEGEQSRPAPTDSGIIDAFIELAEGTGSAVAGFARRYGVLFLCQRHREPCIHNYPRGVISLRRTLCRPSGREPIADWRHYARDLKGILALATAALDGKAGRPEDWEATGGLFDRALGPPTPERARQRVEARVQAWLDLGAVQPRFSWPADAERASLTDSGFGVFGAIGRHLMHRLAFKEGDVRCDGCGREFVPKRRPVLGERHWCGLRECERKRAREARPARRKRPPAIQVAAQAGTVPGPKRPNAARQPDGWFIDWLAKNEGRPSREERRRRAQELADRQPPSG